MFYVICFSFDSANIEIMLCLACKRLNALLIIKPLLCKAAFCVGVVMSVAINQQSGFDGSVAGMSLTDLLQLKSMGRFIGRICVEHAGKTGVLFFRDGDLIHAQLDQFEGKDAFARVLSWGGGSFRVEPKVTSARQTIHEPFQFLLLDAVRLQDELAAGLDQQAHSGQVTNSDPRGGGMKERLSGVAGIQDVALTDRTGAVVQTIGSNAEAVAAQGMYLVSTSDQIAQELGLGGFKGALIQGTSGHLVALEGPRNYLFAGAASEAKPTVVETDIKRALSGQG